MLNGKHGGGRKLKADSFISFNGGFLLKWTFSDKDRAKQAAITRFRFGKCLLNNVLKLMGKHLDGGCGFCVASNVEEEEKEDVKHYLMNCMEYMHLREEVERSIMKEGKVVSVEGDSYFYGVLWDYIRV